MELANDANKKRMRDGKKEPKSVTIVRKVHGIQQSLIMRRLPINVVENDMAGNKCSPRPGECAFLICNP